ncbi:MAG: hypothetical protein ACR65R_04445 [Methylomicrobium sp.]
MQNEWQVNLEKQQYVTPKIRRKLPKAHFEDWISLLAESSSFLGENTMSGNPRISVPKAVDNIFGGSFLPRSKAPLRFPIVPQWIVPFSLVYAGGVSFDSFDATAPNDKTNWTRST